ncbi:MAG: uncharacterized protein A8A55_1118 [Amphiamblys sp. WSBS2006]|nr:MAG: uncharacterized protein A8A55_1118 [Amphiamblys sp. WSBS2006]
MEQTSHESRNLVEGRQRRPYAKWAAAVCGVFVFVLILCLLSGIRKREDVLFAEKIRTVLEDAAPVPVLEVFPERFVIIVIAWKRYKSLRRLMESVLDAEYFGRPVDLKFVIEAGPKEEVAEYVRKFEWPHGEVTCDFKRVNHGLEKNIMTSWYPESNDEYAIMLEDDVEVSRYYFQFVLDIFRAHGEEFKRKGSAEEKIAGVSFFTPAKNELVKNTAVTFGQSRRRDHDYFLFSFPCSWGNLYFPEQWRRFIDYYNIRVSEMLLQDPPIRNICSNKWRNSWKKYYIEFVHMEGLYFLYSNYQTGELFSVNHEEKGVHCGKKNRKVSDEREETLTQFQSHRLVTEYLPEMRDGLTQIKNYPVFDTLHRRVGSLFSNIQAGFYTTERYRAALGLDDFLPEGTCVLDYLSGPFEEKAAEEKYISGDIHGPLWYQVSQAVSLLIIGGYLKRKPILGSMFKTSDGEYRLEDVFSVQNLEYITREEFSKQESTIVVRKINPVGEEFSGSLVFPSKDNAISVPVFRNTPWDIKRKYSSCGDRVLWFLSFKRAISHLDFSSGAPMHKHHLDIAFEIIGKLGEKYICVASKNAERDTGAVQREIKKDAIKRVYIIGDMEEETKQKFGEKGVVVYTRKDVTEAIDRNPAAEKGEKERRLAVAVIEAEIMRVAFVKIY